MFLKIKKFFLGNKRKKQITEKIYDRVWKKNIFLSNLPTFDPNTGEELPWVYSFKICKVFDPHTGSFKFRKYIFIIKFNDSTKYTFTKNGKFLSRERLVHGK